MNKIFNLLLLLALLSLNAFADIRPPNPKPTPSPKAKEEIVVDSEMYIAITPYVNEPVLVISKAKLAELNEAAEEGGAAALSINDSGVNFGQTQTIVGGLFLSFAFVFAGVWLARNNTKLTKSAVGIVVFAVLGMTATIVIGNVPPPKRYGISPSIFSAELTRDNAYSKGDVKILIGNGVASGDVEFLIPEKSKTTIKKEE